MTNNILLPAAVISSALMFGAVEPWSLGIVMLISLTAGFLQAFSLRSRTSDMPDSTGALLGIGCAFIAYGFLQAVPLPLTLLKFLSPKTASLWEFYAPATRSFIPVSFDIGHTVLETSKLFVYLTIFAVSALHFTDREQGMKMLNILIIFGFVLSVFGIIQKAAGTGLIYWFRELSLGGSPFGPFVNRNHFAGFVGMLVPFGLAMIFIEEETPKKILFGFLTVVTTSALFLSLSRGGIISFLCSVSLFSLLIALRQFEQKKLILIALFLCALIGYLIYLGITPVIDRFHQTDISREQRLLVWSASLSMIRDFWLTGTGLGTYISVFPLYAPFPLTSLYDHAHNDYLELAAETGFAGITLAAGFVTVLILRLSRARWTGRTGTLRIAAVCSVFSMLVHSIFDFNLHIPSNALLFSLVLGICTGLPDSGQNAHYGQRPYRGKTSIEQESE